MQRLIQISLLALLLPVAHADDSGWVEKSNAHAQVVLNQLATFNPESAASIGIDGLDEEIMDLGPQLYERKLASSGQVLAELKKRLKEESSPTVRPDLAILIKTVNDNMRSAKLNREHLLPYLNLSQAVFYAVRGLIDPQIPRDRYPAAVVRIERYAGLEDGYVPLTDLAKNHNHDAS